MCPVRAMQAEFSACGLGHGEEGMKLVMFPWMSQGGDIWSSSSVGELAANSVDEVCWEANS